MAVNYQINFLPLNSLAAMDQVLGVPFVTYANEEGTLKVGRSFTTGRTAPYRPINVTDDDRVFDDFPGTTQRLANALTYGGRTYPAGELVHTGVRLDLDSNGDGRADTIVYTVKLGGNTSGVGTVIGFVGTSGLKPNTTYKVISTGNIAGADVPADNLVCFASGTLIATPTGTMRIEDLRVGDPVITRDHGIQPIRWIASRAMRADELAAAPHLRPIRIGAGALGAGLPETDLVVSPQHRVLVRSAIAQRMFGTDEILVAAKHLTTLPGIGVAEDLTTVTYHHMLFDAHEVVISNGAETESLFTGPEALKSVGPAAVAEILTLFPELAAATPSPAQPLAPGRMARSLARRHAANAKPLVC
ncbi:Hint domain-containing protein [Paracoccus sp. p3-h83]|uniref:Hint domain-containing protein n=1 Tax=Paracoccus sp. p3-h83 TaxID=3342805 RepID=UPI0035B6FC06